MISKASPWTLIKLSWFSIMLLLWCCGGCSEVALQPHAQQLGQLQLKMVVQRSTFAHRVLPWVLLTLPLADISACAVAANVLQQHLQRYLA